MEDRSFAGVAAGMKTTSSPSFPILLQPAERSRIARAINDAVDQWLPGQKPESLCTQRATVTAIVLSVLMGVECILQAGSLLVRCDDGDGPFVGWDHEAAGREGRLGAEFHTWVALPGEPNLIVDTSVGHLPRVAANIGVPWRRETLDVTWASHETLWKDGYLYRADEFVTNKVVKASASIMPEAAVVARTVLTRLRHGG